MPWPTLPPRSLPALTLLAGILVGSTPSNVSGAPNEADQQKSELTESSIIDENHVLGSDVGEADILLDEFGIKNRCSVVLVIASDSSIEEVSEYVNDLAPLVVVDPLSREVRSSPVSSCEEISLLQEALDKHIRYEPGKGGFTSDLLEGLKLATQLDFTPDEAFTAHNDEQTAWDRMSENWPFLAFGFAIFGLYVWNRKSKTP